MAEAQPSRPSLHPARFLLLILPFGLVSGFALVTLSFQLTQAGVGAGPLGELLALLYLPQTWKFLWAPIVDTMGSRRGWYLTGATGCAGLGLLLPGALAQTQPLPTGALGAALVAGSFSSTLLAMAVENVMARVVPDGQRGRVAGWYQAGNLGGLGLGGGLALWLIQSAHWSPLAAAGVLAAACGLGVAVMLTMPALPAHEPAGRADLHADGHADAVDASVAARLRGVVRDLWSLVRSRVGALALLVCFLPIGSGAASNFWAAVAGEWQAGADIVALVDGVLAGIVSAAGCLAGGWLCDRIDRRTAYCVYGLMQVAAGLLVAFSPRTPTAFVAGTLLYAFVSGLTYAAFSAVVLEAIGRTAAATKYNLLASLANMPIAWMTLVDGHAKDRGGATGMLLTEAGIASAAIVVFLAAATWTRRAAPAARRAGSP